MSDDSTIDPFGETYSLQEISPGRDLLTETASGAAKLPSLAGYTVLGEIARGGMGCVYAARDLTLDREVAIKTLLPQRDARRFVTESKITARLPHPGIPPVYELGRLDDGSPFLAMKLVRGQTLSEMLKSRPNPRHELPQLVQIFEQIAQAVGFAHAHCIIHRDLKPANVMVGALGEVLVMDWGLAKDLRDAHTAEGHPRETDQDRQTAPVSELGPESETLVEATTDHQSESDPRRITSHRAASPQHTAPGLVMGTPAFMAPEQARGETLDARADVFALGGILTVILTGEAVLRGDDNQQILKQAAAGEVNEAIARLDACRADAELIDIARRCLQPDPAKRPSDGGVVAKLVSEYRQTVDERLRRAETQRAAAQAQAEEQRKRRRVVQVAAGVIAAVLLLGIVGTTWGIIRAERARRDEAEQRRIAVRAQESEARRADAEQRANALTARRLVEIEKINDAVFDIFADFDVQRVKQGEQPLEYVLADRLIAAGQNLDPEAIHDPLLLAKLKQRLGETLIGLGRSSDAIPVLTEARDIRSTVLGPDHPDTLTSMNGLAASFYAAGDLQQALQLCEETLTLCKAKLGADHADTSTTMNLLGLAYEKAGNLQRALPLLEETLKLRSAKLGRNHPSTVVSIGNLAMAYHEAGDFKRALPLHEETLKVTRSLNTPDHPSVLNSMSNLAEAYRAVGNLEKAVSLNEEALKLRRARLGPDHPATLYSMSNLAVSYNDAGKPELALPLSEEAFKLRRARLGPDHPDTLESMNNLAASYWESGNLEKSIPLFEQALRWNEAKLGRNHSQTQTTVANLGVNYRDAGRLDEAIPLLEEAWQASRKYPQLRWVGRQLLRGYVKSEDANKAAELVDELLADARKLHPTDGPEFAVVLGNHGHRLLQAGAYLKAETLLRECLGIFEKIVPNSWVAFSTQSMLGEALLGQEQFDDAESLLLDSYSGLKQQRDIIPPGSKWQLAAAVDRLIKLYTALEHPEEVERWQAERANYAAASNDTIRE